MNIRFTCPICATSTRPVPGRVVCGSEPGQTRWQCPECDHVVMVAGDVDPSLPCCLLCGNHELYKKKDFPHNLGMAILVGACLASTITYWLYDKMLTWAILLGSAAFDGLLYLWMKDVVVCYRCHAHYRGVLPNPEHKPFELTTHERYRQEEIRREELRQQTSREAQRSVIPSESNG